MPELSVVTAITFACADPAALAEFYRRATGATTLFESETSVYLLCGNGVRLGFDYAPGYVPPAWPTDTIPAARIDLTASDLRRDEQRLLALGATRPGHPSDTDLWIFMADPAGHPFALTAAY